MRGARTGGGKRGPAALTQRDIDLLKSLYEYTPKVAVLLTKADLLNDGELREVVEFVSGQLARNLPEAPQVFPYSTKPGFERFRQCLEDVLIGGTLKRFAGERDSILVRKVDTLLRECGDYLGLSLRSAEAVQSERHGLKQQAIGEREIVEEVKAEIRLVVQHAAAGTRANVSRRLESHQSGLERVLLQAFDTEFPKWTKSLGAMLLSFEDWLERALRDELTELSVRERGSFVAPLHKVQKQVFRALNNSATGYRSALCGRSAFLCEPPRRRLRWRSRRPRIYGSAGSSTETGNCCLRFSPCG